MKQFLQMIEERNENEKELEDLNALIEDSVQIKSLLVTLFKSNLYEILTKQEELSLNERLALNKALLPYMNCTE